MSDDKILLYEVKGRVAYITLNRPKAAHSFNLALMKLLHESLQKADKDENVKCILLKSTGNKTFSSGIDIKSTTPDDKDYLESMRIYGRKNTEYMLCMKKPIVTQVQGTSIGYGL